VIAELDRAEIDDLLHAQVVGRIGCHADGLTYVVPVIYAYDGEGLYAYSLEGTKIRMMRANPRVCFEVDEYEPSGSWRSAIVQGTYEELAGDEAKRALGLLTERFAERAATSEGERRRRGNGTPVAFRIRVDEVTGRAARR
jgi:nitroimidazol reductase NimA-like FMN-containing flavoprotein (pyridoxamine 5'-phosphate oxidase superfamily)